MWLLIVLVCAQVVRASFATDATVDVGYAQYVGRTPSNGVSSWLGMRYAAPPLGNLRFAAPQDPSEAGTQQADKNGPICLSTGSGTVPAGQSEDCLFLSIYAPSIATASSNLPVFFFIQGGGFNSNANPNLDGSGLIAASSNSIVVVTINYRVGPYGFLANPESGISSNNGLKDQRKALHWVQEHIAKFGGNPQHVVLGGDSAGAASISLLLTAYGGRDDHIFHGAAAESVSFGTVLTDSEAQYQYDNLTESLGCTGSGALQCLRSLSTAEIQAHNHEIPFPGQARAPLYSYSPVIDGDLVQDLPYNSYANGAFIHVPTIVGDDTNGGTIFTPRDTSSQADSSRFLATQYPHLTTNQLSTIASLYPKPSQGWWRQVSNAYGEMRYMCPGLYISSAIANTSTSSRKHSKQISSRIMRGRDSANTNLGSAKSWAYRFNAHDPDQVAKGLGVPHTTEINAIFGPDNVPTRDVPGSYAPGGSNAHVVPVIQAYWVSFIKTLDPNTFNSPGSAAWQEYYNSDGLPQRLVFEDAGKTQMEVLDSGLRKRCAYLESIGPSIRQ